MTASPSPRLPTEPRREPYREAAALYVTAGWHEPLPLPYKKKASVPVGFTGRYNGPSRPDVQAWIDGPQGAGNIALRLPDHIVGIDVDDYGTKVGADTLGAFSAAHGTLPATWRSTSREGGVSGIYLFRVPPGLSWRGEVGPDIEIVQRRHRYAIVWPSIHPEDRLYRWITPEGLPSTVPPNPDLLPDLPEGWVAALTAGQAASSVERAELGPPGVTAWLAKASPGDESCRQVQHALTTALADLAGPGSSHASARTSTMRLAGMAHAGHDGVRLALATLRQAFLDDVARAGKEHVRNESEANGEWDRMVVGAVKLVAVDGPLSSPRVDPCDPFVGILPEGVTDLGQPERPRERQPEPPGPGEGRAAGNQSAATVVVGLARDRYTLHRDERGTPFALPKAGPRIVRPLRGDTNSLRSELARAYCSSTGKVPPSNALADALNVLEGDAAESDPCDLNLRTARGADGALWLDLGDRTGRAVRVTGERWELVNEPSALFRRTKLTGALPEPARNGSLAPLWELVNIPAEDRPLILAALIATLVPDISHPVVILTAEHGAGKSSALSGLASLLDPSPVPLRRPPTREDDWPISANASLVVAVDNVSTIPTWWSDALCRASTGDGDVRRQLYRDEDVSVIQFRRVVMLSGIHLEGLRDDLADRALVVRLTSLGGRRKLDQEIAEAWATAHPVILGGLLDLAVKVLDQLPRLVIPGEELPRMADFFRILNAVDRVMGTDGVARYRRGFTEMAASLVEGDPLVETLTDRVVKPWVGSSRELLTLLETGAPAGVRQGPDWPSGSRGLTAVLDRQAPTLRQLGWKIVKLPRGGAGNQLRWSLVPPDEAADGD